MAAPNWFLKNDFKVIVAGQDVTNRFRPLLINLQVERSAGNSSDSCNFTLADKNGRIYLPQKRDPIEIYINGQWVFYGFVADVNSAGSKGSGRTLKITGNSIDQGSTVKQPELRSMDNATLAQVAVAWGKEEGLDVKVLGSLASISPRYWLQQHESFHSWAERTARAVGGTVKIIGNRCIFAPRNEGISASGQPLTPITASAGRGGNLLDWDISPILTRPKFKDVSVRYFDRAKGKYESVDINTAVKGVETRLNDLLTVVDKDHAQSQGDSRGKETDREQGGGSCTIVGNEIAEPEAVCNVKGVRRGVDGGYQIDSLTHDVGKSSGFVTDLQLKQPKGGAGSDMR